CLIMFVLTLTYFLYSKRIEFLYYSLYVLFLLFYLSADTFRMHEFFFGSYGLLSYSVFFEMQVAINLAYVLFVIHYLNTKVVYPKLHTALRIISYFLMLVILLDVIFLATGYFAAHIYLLDLERLVMTTFGLFGMIYLLLSAKDNLAYFVVTGSFFYTLGALGLLFFSSRLLMIIGSILEIIIFAAGLIHKIQKEYMERLRFEAEANKNRNKALRAQINPHFIFNSLTSIQHLVSKDERATTLKYLTKFSRLTRNVLESSMDTNVVLADEIKMLEDYLELESLRFSESFTFELEISPSLDTYSIEIPFMLTQPFVENAIVHGLLPKKEAPRDLKITFETRDDMMICVIEDNGIGRNTEQDEFDHVRAKRKSRGLEITKQRIENLGLETTPLEVIDKFDDLGNPSGTKVIIYIPIN
ncbi:MAG: histidine kinase, partial [Bacteroidota bacterium]